MIGFSMRALLRTVLCYQTAEMAGELIRKLSGKGPVGARAPVFGVDLFTGVPFISLENGERMGRDICKTKKPLR